jgi:hypothetical protein
MPRALGSNRALRITSCSRGQLQRVFLGARVKQGGVPTVNSIRLARNRESGDACSHGRHAQTDLLGSHRAVPIKSFARSALRHQRNVLRRTSPERLALSNFDRQVFASPYWIAPRVVNALMIVKLETVIRWHRAGFRSFWRWKLRCRGGRPKCRGPCSCGPSPMGDALAGVEASRPRHGSVRGGGQVKPERLDHQKVARNLTSRKIINAR